MPRLLVNFTFRSCDLATNELIFSDNLYRLLGCEPQSFKPTIENYLKFVHPDDRHIITESEANTLNSEISDPGSYRIIRKDGEMRYIYVGWQVYYDNNRKIHIGIG